MRRFLFVAGAAVVVAGAGAWVWRRAMRASAGGPWTLPGESDLNSWLNGPLHASMAAALDLQPGDELLDVACGDGAFVAGHAAHVRRVAGIDLASVKYEQARRRLADRVAAGTAEIVKGDAGALPWADGSFSVVTCMDALSLLPDPEHVLAEMFRVLRPGGRTVVQIGWRVPDGAPTRKFLGTFWAWDEAEARRMAEAAGFGDVAISYARIGGDNRLGNLLARLAMGTDEIRIVAAVKPVPDRASHDAVASEPVAVG